MKLFSSLPLIALFLLVTPEKGTGQNKTDHSPFATPRGSFPVNPVKMSENRSTNTVLKEDFQDVAVPSLPSGWTSLSPEGKFKTGDADDANAGGYFPVPDIPGNIFAMANDDVCNCDMSNIRLISPSFDLSGLSDMVLRFNAYHDKNWGGGDATAQISTDGGSTWDTLTVLNSTTGWQYYVLDLSAYTGNSNVKVKFQWSDDGTWASGFAVDNVVVDELLANDLRVEKVWTSEMKKDLEYTQLPLDQAQAMKVGARIKNNGHDLQTNTSAAAIISRKGQILVDDTTNSMDLDSMQRGSFWLQTAFTPDSLGVHKVEMEAFSDQAEEYTPDNTMSDSLRMTCDRMARDRGDYNGNSWGTGTYSNGEYIGFQAGNLFGIRSDDRAKAISFLLDTATEAGAKVRGVLYKLDTTTNSFDSVAVTSSYTVQSSDVSSLSSPVWTDLSFDSSIALDSGSFYLASFALDDSSTAKAEVGASGVVPHQTAYFRKDSSSSWKDVNYTPMVRLVAPSFEIGLPEDTMVCSDSSLTLDAGPGDAYMWSTGDATQTVDVSSAGTYSVTVTKGQCQRSDSVLVDTMEFEVALPSDTTVCKDSTVTLDAGPGDSYDWSNGAQTRMIDASGPASYWVTVEKGVCRSSDTTMVDTIEGCNTGIRSHADDIRIGVHPNPAKERLQLDLEEEDLRIERILIRDLEGRLIKEFSSGKRDLTIRELSEGPYLLRIRTEKGVYVKRFMKE